MSRPSGTWRGWPLWLSELLGTALLVAIGGSIVIAAFASGSPEAALLPDPAARRAVTGFLFGGVGALIALSPVGKISGAHINPVVTLAFWATGKMDAGLALGYVVAQLAGGALGGLALRAWGPIGASVEYAATLPGGAGAWPALLGEAAATLCLIVGLFAFIGHRRLRAFTPALFPPLYALLVWLEAPLSGASTNPARSLGPALAAGRLDGWWIYWIGPLAGMFGALAVLRGAWARELEVEVAKVFHFAHDRFGVFGERSKLRRAGSPPSRPAR